tara:strand:+ start:419 stop:700 length:282 start_codon:yes stop_codon:yes gene_type:complete
MPVAQTNSGMILAIPASGFTEYDVTGYNYVRLAVVGDDVKLAFDATSLDSQYMYIPNNESGIAAINLDGINCTLFFRAVGVGISCNVHVICWN